MNGQLLRPPAKLNLGLWVTGRREDGFHEIETLFVRLELHDELRVEPAREVRGEVEAAPGVSIGALAMDSENLVVRAVRAYLDAAGEKGGGAPGKDEGRTDAPAVGRVSAEGAEEAAASGATAGRQRGFGSGAHLRLLKRIPLAAGLGGGSSDAAAALRAMAALYPAPVDLPSLALAIGSDLPFFLSDWPAAWGRGRGELLEPARLPRLPVVLLNPGVPVSAGDAYGLIGGFDRPPERAELLYRLAGGREPGYRNTLEEGVVEEHPVIGAALQSLREQGLRGVLMSGSGSTCFGLAADDEEAQRVATRLRSLHPDWWVWWGGAAV